MTQPRWTPRIVEPNEVAEKHQPHDPTRRGFVVRYKGAATECPGCGRSNWLVGRLSAECAFCTTALPLGRE